MLDYINDTTRQPGLTVQVHSVMQTREKGVEAPDAEMAALANTAHTVCPQWNYNLSPRSSALGV
jgi:hypothetical protein